MEFKHQVSNLVELVDRKQLVAVNPKFKIIYFNFDSGDGLPNHRHNGFATVQVLEGLVEMKFESGEIYKLEVGQILSFDARVIHDVKAQLKSKILVTISESL